MCLVKHCRLFFVGSLVFLCVTYLEHSTVLNTWIALSIYNTVAVCVQHCCSVCVEHCCSVYVVHSRVFFLCLLVCATPTHEFFNTCPQYLLSRTRMCCHELKFVVTNSYLCTILLQYCGHGSDLVFFGPHLVMREHASEQLLLVVTNSYMLPQAHIVHHT